ncbi:MAG: sigma-70 family RNA polymerase sigma factor [Bacteroidota bacterium]
MAQHKRDTYSDQEIIAGIQAGGIQRQRIENYLFDQHAGLVYQGMKRYRLSEVDALDVYSMSILALSEQIRSNRFQGKSKIRTFLFSIFRNRCINKIRDNKTNKFSFVDQIPDLPEKAKGVLEQLVIQENFDKIQDCIAKLGEKCEKILMMRDYYGYSLEEIAKEIGFKTSQSVSSMRYRCMEKLKELIRNNKC